MKTLSVTPNSSSQESRVDRRQFAKNCVRLVNSASDFFRKLDYFIYDSEMLKRRPDRYVSHSFLRELLKTLLSAVFIRISDNSSIEALTSSLRKKLMELKVDLDQLRSTAEVLQKYYKANNLTIDDELRIRLSIIYSSEKDRNFIINSLTAETYDFYDILMKYIAEKCPQSKSAELVEADTNRRLEEVFLFFKEAIEKIQECSFDPALFVSSAPKIDEDLKKRLDEINRKEYLAYEKRNDDLVDLFLEKKRSKFCRS